MNDWARHTGWLHGFMHAWALWAGVVVLAAMVVGAYLLGRHRPDPAGAVTIAVLTAGSALVALAVNQPINHAVSEVRPYWTHPSALVLVGRAHDFSFPSDHAAVAGALAAGLLVFDRRIGTVAAALAALLAFSRIYVGAHYPGDVVGGLLVGAVVTGILLGALYRPGRRVVEWLATTPLRPLLTTRRVGPATDRAGPTGGPNDQVAQTTP